MSSEKDESILHRASKVLSESFELFYSTQESQHSIVVELIKAKNPGCQILQTSVFAHIAAVLDSSLAVDRSPWCQMDLVGTIFRAVVEESCDLIMCNVTLSNEKYKELVIQMPVRNIHFQVLSHSMLAQSKAGYL